MDATVFNAMSGVMGSLVGGSATVATAWVTQKKLNRRELVREEIRKRGLFRDLGLLLAELDVGEL